MLYPAAAMWLTDVRSGAEIEAHVEQLGELSEAEREELLVAAEAYNRDAVHGLIVDPFSNTEGVEQLEVDDDAETYLELLDGGGSDIMARVTIPSIGADLAVRHGSTEATLRRGLGHLYGSSLPVGGRDSHAVITGHSGLAEAELLTRLGDVEIGDDIQVDTMGRTMTYRVHDIEVIEPTDVQALGVERGRDLLSLITCTPIGVNSHRLVVHAERVTDAAAQPPSAEASGAGFPWWALGGAGAVGVWIVLARRTRSAS